MLDDELDRATRRRSFRVPVVVELRRMDGTRLNLRRGEFLDTDAVCWYRETLVNDLTLDRVVPDPAELREGVEPLRCLSPER